jgi:hypothetical protein
MNTVIGGVIFFIVAYDRIKAAATNSEMMVIEESSK